MSHTHTYRASLTWQGSTADGYDGYERTHHVTVPPAADPLTLSSDPAYRGDPAKANPEQLLLAAASSCQLLSFLAYAARSRIDVLAYTDEAEALMPEDDPPVRITQITLRPRITVAAGASVDRVYRLVEKAHAACYIANTLTAEMRIEAEVTT
jgi:organic hydroperoxide reductase OsmC/OhrA